MDRGTLWYQIARWTLGNVIYRALGGIRVIHGERMPPEGAVLVAPTHFSYLDPPLMGASTKRCIAFMAKEELFKTPVLGFLCRSVNAFPIKRGAGDIEAIRIAMGILQSGKAMLIFPEGTRGRGEYLGKMTPGVAMLAKKTGAKVIPAAIIGTHKVLAKGSNKIKRGRMTVIYGEPFTYAEVTEGVARSEEKEVFLNALQDRLLALCAEGGLPLKIAENSLDPQKSASLEQPISESSPGLE